MAGYGTCKSRHVCCALIASAIIARVAGLALPGTYDMRVFRAWTHGATILGPKQVYGTGRRFPTWRELTWDRIEQSASAAPSATTEAGNSSHRRWLTFDGVTTRVDYPPGAVYALAAVGHLYQALFPTFPPHALLTVAIKLLVMLASLGLAVTIMYAVRAVHGPVVGRWAALAFWANPAVYLHGSVLGYLDAVFALPAIGAVIAASRGWAFATGILLAVSCTIKPQGLLVLPAIAVALRPGLIGDWRSALRAALGAALTVCLCFMPIVLAGGWGNLCTAIAHLGTDGQLSGTALNAWWIVTFIGQVAARASATTLTTAVAEQVNAVSIPAFVQELGSTSPVGMSVALVLAAWGAVLTAVTRAAWHVRHTADLRRLAALGAFTVHAYAVLAVQVHENHMYLALPLLAIVVASRPQYTNLFFVMSAVVMLNLNLLYGFGENVGFAIPRSLSVIDLTVIVAAVNCAALVWHMTIFERDCREELLPLSPPVMTRALQTGTR